MDKLLIAVLLSASMLLNPVPQMTGTAAGQEAQIETSAVETEPEEGKYDTVPLLFQSYSVQPFSGGTIATHGCGITCLAMVASYFYEQDFTPEELAKRYNISRTNPAASLDLGLKDMELPLEGVYYGEDMQARIWDALENGQIAIALMHKESIFTNSGHFIVLTGVTEDGKYTVNDPNAFNYDSFFLKEEFKTGFTKERLSWGFIGAYIFKPKSEFVRP